MVTKAFLDDLLLVVELDCRFVAPVRERGSRMSGKASYAIMSSMLSNWKSSRSLPEEMGTLASKMLAMVKTVSCVKALAAVFVEYLRSCGSAMMVLPGDVRSCRDEVVDDATGRVEVEFVVDLWLGGRSMEFNFLNLQVLEGVLRSLRWKWLGWIASNRCCHTSGEG